MATRPSDLERSISLAISLRERFDRLGDDAALDEAVRLGREVLALHPTDHPERSVACGELARSLSKHFDRTGEFTHLDEALELAQEGLMLCPLSYPDRSAACDALVDVLGRRFGETGKRRDLADAIQLAHEALTLRPVGEPFRAVSCIRLARLLRARSALAADEVSMEKAVDLDREALALRPPGHPDRAESCAALATALAASLRYMVDMGTTRLDEAIQLERKALALCVGGHAQRTPTCAHLATSLKMRFEHTGDYELLDEAIRLEREALSLRRARPAVRATMCGNLALSLTIRFKQTRAAGLLDEAVRLVDEALGLLPPDHPRGMVDRTNLAVVLKPCFRYTRKAALLIRAIKLEREVLILVPPGHAYQTVACGNLASSLQMQFNFSGKLATLDRAIFLQRQMLALLTEEETDFASAGVNLAIYLQQRFDKFGDESALDEMAEVLTAALGRSPVGHRARWRCLIQLAILAIRCAEYPVAIRHLRDALESPTYELADLLRGAEWAMTRIETAGVSHEHRQAFLDAYFTALELMVLATSFALDHPGQLQHVLRGSVLAPRGYELASRMGDLPSGLQLLERARGVIWAQALHMRNPQLDNVPIELADKLRALLRDMGSNRQAEARLGPDNRPFLAPQDMLHEQRSRLQQVLREIRSLPGQESFMRGPDRRAILGAAARNPVVILVAGQSECYALIITSPDKPLAHIVLDVDTSTCKDLTFIKSVSQKRGVSSGHDETERLDLKVSKGPPPSLVMLSKIWRLIVKPVIAHLGFTKSQGRSRPRIHWCSTGAFASVPVHAAGIYEGPEEECCADYVVSSYTPTFAALVTAQQGAKVYTPSQTSILLVPAGRAHDSSMPTLRCVEEEADNVHEIAARAGASTTTAVDLAGVAASLQSASIAHIACHGIQHSREPHKSRFCLSDGNISISELMQLDLRGAFLAFLSACETAKGDWQHPDEAVHLAAAMLFVGFRSVVASMWAMRDHDGPRVAGLFYEQLLDSKAIEVDTVPYALDYAIMALRAEGASPERWATFIHIGA